MADTEVGIRLSLRGRREARAGLEDVAEGARDVGEESRTAGRRAADAARGLAALADRKITAGIKGTAGAAKGLASVLAGPVVGGAKAAGAAAGLAAFGLGALAVSSVQAASDAAETGAAFGTVYGDAAGAAQSWIDTQSKAYGINSAELQQALIGFGGLGKQVGLTGDSLAAFGTDLSAAAMDLGSFWNKSTEETLAAIQSGLTGEAEPLKAYGIFMSDAALNAFAMSEGIGKTTDKMSEQEKIALRQMFILANLGDAQGDLARTSGGLANQQRALTGRWLTAKQMLGEALTPAALGLVSALNTGLSSAIDWLTPRMDGLSAAAEQVGARFETAGAQVNASSISGTVDAIAAKGEELATVGTSIRAGFAAMPISPLQLLGGALSWAADNAGLVRGVLTVLLPIWGAYRVALIASRVATATATAVTTGYTVASSFLAGAKGREAVGIAASTAASRAYAVGAGIATAAQWLWNTALSANPIALVVLAIAGLVAAAVWAYNNLSWFKTGVDAVWGALKTAGEWLWNTIAPFTPLGAAIHLVVDHWDDLTAAVGWAWDKLKGFWNWISDKGGALLEWFGIGDDDSGSGGGSGGGSSRGSIPGREHGGPVRAGQPYIVGEKRPELFVPGVDGTIVPRVPTSADPGDEDDVVGAGIVRGGDLNVNLLLDGRVVGGTVIRDFRDRQARA